MKFTIYTPLYNMEKYIGEAIESVLNQTYNDFEYIIINDGSTDNSLRIVNEYASKDNRIRVIDQANKGLFHSRIVAFENAKGDYLIGLDSDDLLKNDALLILDNAISKESNPDMIMYRYERFSEYDQNINYAKKSVFDNNEYFDNEDIYRIYDKVISTDRINSMCFKAVRRDCLLDNVYINSLPRITVAEDRIHTLNCLPYIKSAKYITDILYRYRYTPNSMTNKFDASIYEGNLLVLNEMNRFADRVDYQISKDTINLYFTKKLLKLIAYAPNQIHGNIETKKAYKDMVRKISKDLKENKIVLSNHISIIYKMPKFMLMHGMVYSLYVYKLFCERLRYIIDKVRR